MRLMWGKVRDKGFFMVIILVWGYSERKRFASICQSEEV